MFFTAVIFIRNIESLPEFRIFVRRLFMNYLWEINGATGLILRDDSQFAEERGPAINSFNAVLKWTEEKWKWSFSLRHQLSMQTIFTIGQKVLITPRLRLQGKTLWSNFPRRRKYLIWRSGLFPVPYSRQNWQSRNKRARELGLLWHHPTRKSFLRQIRIYFLNPSWSCGVPATGEDETKILDTSTNYLQFEKQDQTEINH